MSATAPATSWVESTPSNLPARRIKSAVFRWVCWGFTCSSIVLLAVLIYHVTKQGLPWLSMEFLTKPQSTRPADAGIRSAIAGTLWVIGMTAMISIPIGIGAAVYLEEFARKNRISTLIEINIANLAGVPSIVYGILGLVVFVQWFKMGKSVLAGACTMSLLILPVIIIASREAIRAVPQSLRQAAYALGATKWQTVLHHVLPAALPGILTGTILALSRAIGETAPLVVVGAQAFMMFPPEGPLDYFMVLPTQIYEWASRPVGAGQDFSGLAAAAILVLLVILFLMNGAAVWIRHKAQRRLG